MKREPQDDEFAQYSKRQRYDGSANGPTRDNQRDYNKNNQHANSKPRQNGPKDKKSKTSQQPSNHVSTAPPTPSAPVDPAVALETLLKTLTAHPDAVQQALGSSALENATSLLTCLTSRTNKSAKGSLDLFHPASDNLKHPSIHTYTLAQSLQAQPLPPLPSIPEGPYSRAVFIHKSTTQHDRVSGSSDLTYEKLEFLGDAYIEIIATRIIFARYPELPAGRQAQTRERVVKNETLAQYSIAYGFRERLVASDIEASSKAATKILADVFEAYVAAIVLTDPEQGFQRAEEWLTELWAPILLEGLGSGVEQQAVGEYNGNAKQELQQKILANDTKLEYLEERPMEQSKHAQKYFIALFLTGYGHEKRKIGYGEGRNKVEAGNRAAMQAMDQNRDIVDDAAKQLAATKEKRRLEKEKEKGHEDGSQTA